MVAVNAHVAPQESESDSRSQVEACMHILTAVAPRAEAGKDEVTYIYLHRLAILLLQCKIAWAPTLQASCT